MVADLAEGAEGETGSGVFHLEQFTFYDDALCTLRSQETLSQDPAVHTTDQTGSFSLAETGSGNAANEVHIDDFTRHEGALTTSVLQRQPGPDVKPGYAD